MARLKQFYFDTVVKQLKEQFNYTSVMQVPRISKITLNMGVGDAVADKKVMDNAVADMEKIAGQKPIVTLSKKSVAAFKIRDNYPVGCKVTLRKTNMYTFLDRLINIAIPRERDFRGLSAKSFDGRGNFNMGIMEQIIFPEIQYDKIDKLRGMNITITTTAKTDEEANALLSAFSFPLREKSAEEALAAETAPAEEAPAAETTPTEEKPAEEAPAAEAAPAEEKPAEEKPAPSPSPTTARAAKLIIRPPLTTLVTLFTLIIFSLKPSV